jgi:hypothetical protein
MQALLEIEAVDDNQTVRERDRKTTTLGQTDRYFDGVT